MTTGTFACPICGFDKPHIHDADTVARRDVLNEEQRKNLRRTAEDDYQREAWRIEFEAGPRAYSQKYGTRGSHAGSWVTNWALDRIDADTARIAELEAALAAEKEGRRKAEADNAELRRALKEDGETMQKAIVIHEKCHVERNEQRMRAVAAEQEAFGARSQLLKAEERAERLRKYAVAIQNGGHYEALQPGDLDAPKKTP